jgi:hypothetical protein
MIQPGQLVIAREAHRQQLMRAVRRGTAERIRVGAYVGTEEASGSPFVAARRRAVRLAEAVHRQLRATHFFSHQTAALLWGCALWDTPAQTHLWQAYRPSGSAAADLRRHTGVVAPGQRARAAGLPVTSLERTVVDCALTLHPLEALVIADSALRLVPALDLDAARSILATVTRRNGTRRAGWVLDHADAGAESPWESWIRYLCLRVSMPRPVTQVPVQTRRRLYHCDLGWPDHGVYVEFDGRVKYVDDGVRRGHDARRELEQEKRRADALHEAGIHPIRCMAADATPRRGEESVVQRIAGQFPAALVGSFRTIPFLPPPSVNQFGRK